MSNNIDFGRMFIKDAFTRWYRVPEYQRPYVWGNDQVNDLLEDVTQALSTNPDGEYFLGSIVLQKRSVKDDDGEAFEENDLLDGQQRLTTCLMIHAVGRDLTEVSKLKESCRNAIFQEENRFDGIPERLRIVYDTRDETRQFVDKFLKSSSGTDNEDALRQALNAKDASVRNMANAVLEIRRFFKDPQSPKLEDFFPYFRNKALLIYVASARLEDAFRLFTVLNDRGMRLRNSDILKTINLKALKETNASPQDQRQAAKMWEDLEGELDEYLDAFLSHLRTILVKEKARLGLLQEFEENIYKPREFDKEKKLYKFKPPLLKPGRDTFDFIKCYFTHYQQILSGKNHHIGNSWEFDNLITLLNEAGLADFWLPPLLHFREVFGEEGIVKVLRKLENKFSGDWIARETPTFRIEAMNGILKKIDEVSQKTSLTKAHKLDELLSSPVFDFDDVEFFKQLDTADIYGRRFARYILYKIDMVCGGPSNRLQPPKEVSVEHILPQTPETSSQWCKDFSEQERTEWTDRLGNLVLISGRKNSSQGRLDYIDKKKKYFTDRIETFPNSMRVLTTNDVWTPKTLKCNHEEVLKRLKSYHLEKL